MNAYRVPLESTSIKYIVTAITLYLCLQKIFIKLNNKSIYIVNAPDGIPPIFLVWYVNMPGGIKFKRASIIP